jgi:hypothetical protein
MLENLFGEDTLTLAIKEQPREVESFLAKKNAEDLMDVIDFLGLIRLNVTSPIWKALTEAFRWFPAQILEIFFALEDQLNISRKEKMAVL